MMPPGLRFQLCRDLPMANESRTRDSVFPRPRFRPFVRA